MGKTILSITMSLDGFVAGPNDGPENPLGDGGMGLFTWFFAGDVEVPIQDGRMTLKLSKESAPLFTEGMAAAGAMICGRRMFDISNAWEGHPPIAPCFVVTHHPAQEWVRPGSPFTFVTEGIESAVRQAQQAAGDKNVAISSPSIAQQCLRLGLLDEISLGVAPVLLGGGVSLFDHFGGEAVQLERTFALAAPFVTHLNYRVIK